MSTQYARASSTEPKSVALIDRLTNNAVCLCVTPGAVRACHTPETTAVGPSPMAPTQEVKGPAAMTRTILE
ncbi:hypothetical protein Pyn_29452 [Prunus yedoensis var. nudiflora]|uniref:Uncharacterized protein n=1 Tax=Prunus yedoensis var. nudiflora TaxID=2094558 RepID=A0A315AUV8_PRUYE|nr:hypothetical protein Pyn_29452 [Prunus yedoensis var. nudiflora]